ncbi:hypothetical protein NF212_25365 (plasmid) [Parasalinivibrio latis]|uniref:hypothetical protein n=1 Tax=Parasalinivibrio latis TaxID=2952610 RepID=UPI0030E0D47D
MKLINKWKQAGVDKWATLNKVERMLTILASVFTVGFPLYQMGVFSSGESPFKECRNVRTVLESLRSLNDIRWKFSRVPGRTLTSKFQLRSDGLVGIYDNPNEHSWRYEGLGLILIDENGYDKIRFNSSSVNCIQIDDRAYEISLLGNVIGGDAGYQAKLSARIDVVKEIP